MKITPIITGISKTCLTNELTGYRHKMTTQKTLAVDRDALHVGLMHLKPMPGQKVPGTHMGPESLKKCCVWWY